MELIIKNNLFRGRAKGKKGNTEAGKQANLTCAKLNCPYIIKGIDTGEEAMKDFLFTLGCFEGEEVTVISELAGNYIIHLKGARYSIDKELSKAILI